MSRVYKSKSRILMPTISGLRFYGAILCNICIVVKFTTYAFCSLIHAFSPTVLGVIKWLVGIYLMSVFFYSNYQTCCLALYYKKLSCKAVLYNTIHILIIAH